MYRRDAGRRDDLATRHFILPHEMNSELHAKEKTLITSFDGLESRLGRHLGLTAMVEYVNRATVGMACVCQKSIDPAPFLPHHRKDSRLGIIVTDVDVEKSRTGTKLGRYGGASCFVNVAAGHKPIIFYQLRGKRFSYARLSPSALKCTRRSVQFCDYVLQHQSQWRLSFPHLIPEWLPSLFAMAHMRFCKIQLRQGSD